MSIDLKPDSLKMFFGFPYQLTEEISIRQPTVGDIVEFGEDRFWSFVTRFAGNTTALRVALWDVGIDWNKITDWQLFVSQIQTYEKEETQIFFGDQLDFTRFTPVSVPALKEEEGEEETEPKTEIILVNADNPEIQLNEEIYSRMVQFIRMATGYNPKVEKAKGKLTKQSIIDEEKMNARIRQMKQNKEPLYGSLLLPLFSFCLNHEGFKYKRDEILEMTLFTFMDSVKRIQSTEGIKALMSGMYSGFMDTSKITDKDLNFTKDLYEAN